MLCLRWYYFKKALTCSDQFFGVIMYLSKLLATFLLFSLMIPKANAGLNLNVKIGQLVGNQLVEINKSISGDYNKEIIISPDGFKNKIILKFKKFSNVLVNGNKISPVQVDMQFVNELKKVIGRTQTVTSFYNRSAEFAIRTSGRISDSADLNVSLNFEETN